MSNWEATNQLRFVERSIKGKWIGDYYGEPMYESRVVRILQQKWLGEAEDSKGFLYEIEEWRDVPVVEEE
jgi:hypothetical protein